MHVTIGYAVSPIRVNITSKPVMGDGGAFYAVAIRGTTAKGEEFHLSVFSENPIEFEGDEKLPIQDELIF